MEQPKTSPEFALDTPSAEDLDAVAADQKIADATAPLQTNEPTDEQVLDAALEAQGDEEVAEPSAAPETPASPSLEIQMLWSRYLMLSDRITALEARLEDHNTRSGHKI